MNDQNEKPIVYRYQKMEPDDVMHIEYEEANKLTFYAIAEQKILEIEGEPMSEYDKYRLHEQYRNFYFAADIILSKKAQYFYEYALRYLHPSIKLKDNSRSIIRAVCHVFMRELAENCLEQLDKCPYKNEIDQEIVADAYMQFKKSQYRNNNISQLFK